MCLSWFDWWSLLNLLKTWTVFHLKLCGKKKKKAASPQLCHILVLMLLAHFPIQRQEVSKPFTFHLQVLNFLLYGAALESSTWKKENHHKKIVFSLIHSQSWIIPLYDWKLIPSDFNIQIYPFICSLLYIFEHLLMCVRLNCIILSFTLLCWTLSTVQFFYLLCLSTSCHMLSASDSLLVPSVHEWWSQPSLLSSMMRNWRGARGWALFVFSN